MLKKIYFKCFSVCYSYEKVRDPNYPLFSSAQIFSAIITAFLTNLFLMYYLFFEEHFIPNRLIVFMLGCWGILITLNYFLFKGMLQKNKIEIFEYSKNKKKYYAFVILGFFLVFSFIKLAILYHYKSINVSSLWFHNKRK